MKESVYKTYDELPLFLNAKWGPSGNVKHFRWERRSSGMSEPCRVRRGEGYGACDDEVAKVLGIVVAKSAQLPCSSSPHKAKGRPHSPAATHPPAPEWWDPAAPSSRAAGQK